MSYVTCFLICCSYFHIGLPLGYFLQFICTVFIMLQCLTILTIFEVLMANLLCWWLGRVAQHCWTVSVEMSNVSSFFLSFSLSLFFFNMEIYSFPFFMMDLLIPVSVCWKTLVYVNYVHSKWNSKVFTDYVSARWNDFSNYKDHRMELTYYPVLTCRTHTIHILLGCAGLQKLYKYSIPWRIPNSLSFSYCNVGTQEAESLSTLLKFWKFHWASCIICWLFFYTCTNMDLEVSASNSNFPVQIC